MRERVVVAWEGSNSGWQKPHQDTGLPGDICTIQGRREHQGGGTVIEFAYRAGDVRTVSIRYVISSLSLPLSSSLSLSLSIHDMYHWIDTTKQAVCVAIMQKKPSH